MTPDDNKRFATLQALGALRGISVQRFERDDGRHAFLATRWALTRELPDLAAVQQFLAVQGAIPALQSTPTT